MDRINGLRRPILQVTGLFAVLLAVSLALHRPGLAPAQTAEKVRKAYGIEKRVPWTTSRIRGSPEPPSPYRAEVAFPNLKFYEPLVMTTVPGTDLFVVAERPGKIFTFSTDLETAEKNLLVDVGRTVYGVAFHPRFQENGHFFVSSVLDPLNPSPSGSRLSRYRLVERNPLRADPASEEVLLEWRSGGHNGGCLRFGPDGYLYMATGDGSGIADELETGQDISDLLASVLRIDVDQPASRRPYSIPADNPFVATPGARGEVWAYGLRQIWKFSFDPATGNLWGGEVGQDLWEMVYLIEKGGNYGWSVQEGRHPFRPQRAKGPTAIVPPIVDHNHTEFRSITGGYVYHGKRLPELRGAYVYGDYDTGRVWSLRYDGERVTDHRELTDTQYRIVVFGQDHEGEIYFIDFMGGRIYHLVPAPPAPKDAPQFPLKLSETGLFTSTKGLQSAPGLIPYSVNAALWSDGATKERYLALPGNSQIRYNTLTYPQPAPGALPGWQFPDGAVAVKTFSLEMEAGNPASLRRLETRLLVHEEIPGTDEVGAELWHGYTYVWNDEQTDAYLLEKEGLDRTYTILDPAASGGKREQTWRFPSRAECTLCHTMPAKYVLGINTLQMNKDHDYGGVIANQLATLNHLGIFTEPLPDSPENLPRLYDYEDENLPLDRRARSYLHSNCAHCHRKWGGGNAEFQLVYLLPLEETGTVGVRPGHGEFGLTDPRVLAPGSPARSMVLHRMTMLDLGRMPHIASNVVDEKAVQLIRDWLETMPEK